MIAGIAVASLVGAVFLGLFLYWLFFMNGPPAYPGGGVNERML
jgi:hypothetical protein